MNSTTLPLRQVSFRRGFLADRLRLVREVVIPYQWEALNDRVPGAERSGTVSNFQIAAGEKTGAFHGFWFQDSDLAKWIEAASYRLATHPDPRLEAEIDRIVATIAKAQQPDGYLDTYVQLVAPDQRWANLHEWHELYIAGHFIEAGVAHFEATGKRSLLDVVRKLADLIERTFGTGSGQIPGYPGHEEIELALAKLARATGEKRYARLAAYFLNQRGTEPNYFEAEIKRLGVATPAVYFHHDRWAYLQAHRPVREQTEPVGHSVRAMYLYTAMADLARELGDESLAAACRTVWASLVRHHLYVTGGIGAEWMGEKFSERYDLPNDRAYAESCAGIGLIFFARRLLDLELRGEYGDVMERALYNNVLAGMAEDGRRFFYVNPLELSPVLARRRYDQHYVKPSRVPWFGCACCPPNIARLCASLADYAYSALPDGLAIHLYADSELVFNLEGADVRVSVATDYPWDGEVKISMRPPEPAEFALRLRLPGWCRAPRAAVNGADVNLAEGARDGYLHLVREWRAGDTVALSLPMPPERVRAHPHVAADAGCVALQRGPIVYCFEETDNGPRLATRLLPKSAPLGVRLDPRLFGGIPVIEAEGRREEPAGEALYSTAAPRVEPAALRAVPYCLWNNRGEGEMRVWLREG